MIEFIKANRANPIFQALCILLMMAIFMGINRLIQSEDSVLFSPAVAWEIMASFILFFALVNCVFSLHSDTRLTYWRNSIFSFFGLLFLGGLLAYGISGIGIFEAGSISWILFIFSFSYLIFLSIVNIMRFIVELAQKQDSRLRGED